jgi:hypothetical protein
LTRHYRQAFDYWTRLVPGRPRYVILCNFDEFWVYDFDTQMDAPVDRIKLTELAGRWGALGFLFPTPLKAIFANDQVAVTRKAADQLADCFNKIVDKNRPGGPIDRPHAQCVEDMHQLCHVGDNGDKGGNRTQVRFFDRGTNMHALWDSGMIERVSKSEDVWLADVAALDTPGLRWTRPRPAKFR